ncbi:isoamyl acetate-hydrolyzing esterase [Mycoemilia scoparia]|uniref:Isoamyl acetate-hydrolyzing esterase n=1 Tax=Mycoemilia scoparia TaxID=417184 RepID=A0A9W7ZYU6_9FUNG|nr:isoamyl acetate-hydrolyzing esterase [Mycoemilia scoparia]KAJ1915554.1 isoamyl acetate-hydrolyzing esterase [Mycoemilia scoparia]
MKFFCSNKSSSSSATTMTSLFGSVMRAVVMCFVVSALLTTSVFNPDGSVAMAKPVSSPDASKASSSHFVANCTRTDSLYVRDAIINFGDSITRYGFNNTRHGYSGVMANSYLQKLDILGRGYSGYNSTKGLELLPYVIPNKKYYKKKPCFGNVRLLTLFFGTNDAVLPGFPQHIEIPDYLKNMEAMVNMVRDPKSEFYHPDTRILFIAPGPVHVGMWNRQVGSTGQLDLIDSRDNNYVKQYCQALVDLGKKLNIPTVDSWNLIMDQINNLPSDVRNGEWNGFDRFFVDGLHPNDLGNDIIFNNVMSLISKYYPEIAPAKLGSAFP